MALAPIFLSLDIVDHPVTPVPEAAYSLLRRAKPGEREEVECVRFAWNPSPERIELICAEDLRVDIVRRRAVFRWVDSPRKGTGSAYAVQKIVPSGGTYVPDEFVDAGR